MKIRFYAEFCTFLVVLVCCSSAAAQFDNIFNIPPDEVPLTIQPNTQVNVFESGQIAAGYSGGQSGTTNVEFNFFGGEVGSQVFLRGDRATISGGTFGDQFEILSGEMVIEAGDFGGDVLLEVFDSGMISGGQFGPGLLISGNYVITDGTFGTPLNSIGQVDFQGGTAGVVGAFGTAFFNGGVFDEFDVHSRAVIDGGAVTSLLTVQNSAALASVISGTIGCVDVLRRGRFLISGGEILGDLNVLDEDVIGRASMSGGNVKGNMVFAGRASLTLRGAEFQLIDIATGELIKDLTPILDSLGILETYEINERDVALVGILSDGSDFRYDLNSTPADGSDFASSTASIKIAQATPPPASFIPVSDFTILRGNGFGFGNEPLADLAASDDMRSRFNRGFVFESTAAPLWLIFEGQAPGGVAGDSLQFVIESNAGTPGLTKTFEFWDFTFGQYFVVTTDSENFNIDEVVVVEVPSLMRYLDLDGSVRARVGWRETGFLINFPWEVRIDHVVWSVPE